LVWLNSENNENINSAFGTDFLPAQGGTGSEPCQILLGALIFKLKTMKLSEINWESLQAPFIPRWRVQSVKDGNAICVPYIDARAVHERLDEVLTPANWQNNYQADLGVSTIGILIDNDWVFKSDVGTDSKVEAIKGKASDAFKRAAVIWGIGRNLYSIQVRVLASKDGKHAYTAEGQMLITGDQLSNYLNGMTEGRMLISQLWKQNPGLHEDQRFRDAMNILKEVVK